MKIISAIVALLSATACVYPSLPPPRSSSHFVRNKNIEESPGSLSLTTGISAHKLTSDPILVLFPSEVEVTLFKNDSNFFSLNTRSGVIFGYEGNYRLLQNDHLRLGFLQGTGFGTSFNVPISNKFGGSLWWDADVGLMLEVRPEKDYALHGCGRYTAAYSGPLPSSTLVQNDSISNYFEGVFGYTKFVGRVGFGPEIWLGYEKILSIDNRHDIRSAFNPVYRGDVINFGAMFSLSAAL